jgi:very-short-patch-repair endonuclease
VELDGSVHGQPGQPKRDLHRDVRLKNLGYTVARFPNGIVLEAPQQFVDKVLRLVRLSLDAFSDEL